MAVALGIIRGHQGAIKAYSEPGKDSTFKVLFPAVPSIPEDQEKKKVEEKLNWPGGGTILLVDDEEIVLQVGKRMLERIGFNVITARDGQEAVECFRNQGDQIQCILLDLTMPRMDGEECLRELYRLRKDVRVILTSGYNAQEVAKRFADKGQVGFIQKPYTLTKLKEVLKTVLG